MNPSDGIRLQAVVSSLGKRIKVTEQLITTLQQDDVSPANVYTKVQSDQRYEPIDSCYTKAESNQRYEPIDSCYTKAESDQRYEPIDSCYTKAESDQRYEPFDSCYTKTESDNKYATKAEGGTATDKIVSATAGNTLKVNDEAFKVLELTSPVRGELFVIYDMGFGQAKLQVEKNFSYIMNQHRFSVLHQTTQNEAMTIWGDLQGGQIIPTVEFPLGVSVLLKSSGQDQFSVINKLALDAKADITRQGAIQYTDQRFIDYFVQEISSTHSRNGVFAAVRCANSNRIEIYSNQNNLGSFYQAIGQTNPNMVLEANFALQLVSKDGAISVYNSKALTTGNMDINWRGLVVNSIDRSDANLIQAVQITSANGPTMSMNAGKVLGANTAAPTDRANFMSIVQENDTRSCIFTISPQNPATRSTFTGLIMVPDNMTTHPLPTGLRAAFTQPVGYMNSTYLPSNANEFTNKRYVDNQIASISTGGGSYQPYRISLLRNVSPLTNGIVMAGTAGVFNLTAANWVLPAGLTFHDSMLYIGGFSSGTTTMSSASYPGVKSAYKVFNYTAQQYTFEANLWLVVDCATEDLRNRHLQVFPTYWPSSVINNAISWCNNNINQVTVIPHGPYKVAGTPTSDIGTWGDSPNRYVMFFSLGMNPSADTSGMVLNIQLI